MPELGKRKPAPREFTAVGVHVFAGGFTLGVEQHFRVLCHLEHGRYGVATARMNWPDMPIHTAEDEWPLEELEGRVDLVFANPPCALFSSAGIATTRGPDAWREDPRLDCWRQCFSVLERVRPRAWVLESVTQAYTKGREVVDDYTRRALAMGYSVRHVLVDGAWTGLPQRRKRFFLVVFRPESDVRFAFDFGRRLTTVNEALRTTEGLECGFVGHQTGKALFGQYIAETPQGGRLSESFNRRNCGFLRHVGQGQYVKTVWQDQNPGTRGQKKVKGRPGFNYRRLREDEQMGAFTGDFFAHPTEDRFVGTVEMRALCGYPLDFQLEGKPGGHASLLARAVMPPVAEWLARSVADGLRRRVEPQKSVVLIDLRREGVPPVDLTARYGEPRPSTAWQPPRDPVPAPEVTREPVRPSRPVPKPHPAVVASGGPEVPEAGEGSGAFVRRLWMTGLYSPDRLAELVRQNWEGRTTTRSDVYWNYRKLLDTGTPGVPPWPRQNGVKLAAKTKPQPRVSGTPAASRSVRLGTRPLLLTGSTPMQVGSEKTALRIVTAMAAWREALAGMGYGVDWRPVTAGEDLSAYDAVLAAVNKPNSIASRHSHGALWALMTRPDAVAAFDDWQTGHFFSGVFTVARDRERMFRLKGSDLPGSVIDRLFAFAGEMAGGGWRWRSLVPTFRGGRVALLQDQRATGHMRGIPGEVVGVDPTAYTRRYDLPDPLPDKERRWVHASLLRKEVPRVGWPLDEYGRQDRGLHGVGRAGADALPRLPESELMPVYCRSWGVLSPAHYHAGSGWWRVRFLMSADAGCVLSACRAEAAVLGEPYVRASDPREVECLSSGTLRRWARDQRECLKAVQMTREEVKDRLNDLIKGAKR